MPNSTTGTTTTFVSAILFEAQWFRIETNANWGHDRPAEIPTQ